MRHPWGANCLVVLLVMMKLSRWRFRRTRTITF